MPITVELPPDYQITTVGKRHYVSYLTSLGLRDRIKAANREDKYFFNYDTARAYAWRHAKEQRVK